MADIDSIIAGVSGNTRANFSELGNILPSYWAGLDQKQKQLERDAFKDGLPTKDGNIDYSAVQRRLLETNRPEQAAKFGNLGLYQQQLDLAREAGNYSATGGAQPSPSANIPPSSNRSGATPVAPAITGGSPASAATSPKGDQPGSIVGLTQAAGVPDELAGPIIQQVSAMAGIDPNAAVPPNVAPRVQQVIQAAATRLRAGSNAAPQPVAAPVAAPQQVQNPFSNAVARGLIPAGVDPVRYVGGLKYRAAMLPEGPAQKMIQSQLDAITKASEMTTEQKNAAASGMSTREYIDRNDTQTTERAILTNSILPKLDKSQDAASASRDEIQAINRSREQLDAPGGIFSGAAADVRLKLAKVADFLGVPNTDKIANTESFGSAIGSRVLSLVKGLGAGAGISNADRDFAAAMAGGNIKLDEQSIRRILDIGEKAARTRIDQHNKLVDRTLKANDQLKEYSSTYHVDAPATYQRAKQEIRDGQIAINPKTNERLIRQGGKWVPVT